MAYVSIGSVTSSSIEAYIDGLQYPSYEYDQFRMSIDGGPWHYVSSPPEGNYSDSTTFFGLSPNTSHTVYGEAQYQLTWYSCGSASATTSPEPVLRPSNWYWSYAITSGGDVYAVSVVGSAVTAYIMPSNEWNNFTQRINQFRIYKGYSAASFTTATAGTGCTPSMLNEAINAINGMGFSLPQASSGNISASTFINMRDTLNSIN